MAAFAASPMPYRNFAATAIPPARADQAINHAAAAKPLVEARPAAAFPLLIAALPEVIQFPMPHPPAVEDTAPAKPLTPAPKSKEALPSLGMRASEMSPAPRQIETLEVLSPAAISLPVSQASVVRKPKPHTAAPPQGNNGPTPLAAMFHILQAGSPPRQERTAPQSKLQNMFRRL
jgi:hypothetical protein